MILEAIKRLLKLRSHYRNTFLTPAGKEVLTDLIRKHIISDPLGSDRDITLINLGMQRATVQILQKVYGSDKDLHDAIAREYEQDKNPNP